VSKDSQATWTKIYTWTVPTAELFGQIWFSNQGAIDSITQIGLGTPVRKPVRLGSLAGITEGGSAGAYTYTGNGTVAAFGTSQTGMADKVFGATASGSITVPLATVGTGRVGIVLTGSATPVAFNATFIGVGSDSPYAAYLSGSAQSISNSVTPGAGDLVRIARQGNISRLSVSKDNGATFTLVKEFSSGSQTAINAQLYLTGTTSIGPIYATGVTP
jgi:hypothetical protein